ncbi:uncharacterized protein LOC110710801 [Chenopodium quinoa]|uniref:uncharacterized protein LOC110710801 n=1 Tax=Chenopodium quinoa TaxID=63459 RepID=UPI000B780D87|nr:uncharacterized protein LOC110710801 [Chenopodium quinoa]
MSSTYQNEQNPKLKTREVEEKKREDGEEKEECAPCWMSFYMEAGGCGDEFIQLDEHCGVENNFDKCNEVNTKIVKCMEANPKYFQLFLQAIEQAKEVKENDKHINHASSKGVEEIKPKVDG